jgi:hypothetical protein
MRYNLINLPSFEVNIIFEKGTNNPGIGFVFDIGEIKEDKYEWFYSHGFKSFFVKELSLTLENKIKNWQRCGDYDINDPILVKKWDDYIENISIVTYNVLKKAKRRKWIIQQKLKTSWEENPVIKNLLKNLE